MKQLKEDEKMKLQLIITNSRGFHGRQRWGILAEHTSPLTCLRNCPGLHSKNCHLEATVYMNLTSSLIAIYLKISISSQTQDRFEINLLTKMITKIKLNLSEWMHRDSLVSLTQMKIFYSAEAICKWDGKI